MAKIRVGILFGGKSAEHEVSIQSARNVYEAIDKKKYAPYLIGINQAGQFLIGANATKLLENPLSLKNQKALSPLIQATIPPPTISSEVEVFFPILHGPYGEDGTIQGLLKLLGKPFVGSSVLGSSVGMDKEIMKKLLLQEGLPVVRFSALRKSDLTSKTYELLKHTLGRTLFIKPANLGSSVGVHKVTSKNEFQKAVTDAFLYDTKILIEEAIGARELECAILGNENPKASVVGEIIPTHEFYSYESKYLDENGAKLEIPAHLTKQQQEAIKKLAIHAFTTLQCAGLARVDFFMDRKTKKIYINEINTMPGFTSISMYPKLWEATGLPYTELISRLIELAIERHTTEKSLKTSR